jgi:predicted DNA-binding transcriptional regulator YafY
MNVLAKVVKLDRTLHNNKWPVQVEKIVEELECSRPTFFRIKNLMVSQLGAPIEFSKKYNGYCYNPAEKDSFELPGLWFNRQEIEALLCMDCALESMQEGFLHTILKPLQKRCETLLKAQKTSFKSVRNRIKIIPIASRTYDADIFSALADAIFKQRRICIEHSRLGQSAPFTRTISPQALIRYRDNWYVDAFCHTRNDLRTFALNRIQKTAKATGAFRPVTDEEREAFYGAAYGIFTGPAKHTAVIEFYGVAAHEVSCETWHPRQVGEWKDKSTYCLTLPYGNSRELIMDILKWGDGAFVVEPKELRDEVAGVVKKMLGKYEES